MQRQIARVGLPPPPQHGLDTRLQLLGAEWLDDVIVGAHLQAAHDVALLPYGCHEDNRHVIHFAQALAGRPAVHVRHHDVQQNQVRLPRIRLAQPFHAIARDLHEKALALQLQTRQRRQRIIIFDD